MRRPEKERCEKLQGNSCPDWWKCFGAVFLFAGLVLAGNGPSAFAVMFTPGDILVSDVGVVAVFLMHPDQGPHNCFEQQRRGFRDQLFRPSFTRLGCQWKHPGFESYS